MGKLWETNTAMLDGLITTWCRLGGGSVWHRADPGESEQGELALWRWFFLIAECWEWSRQWCHQHPCLRPQPPVKAHNVYVPPPVGGAHESILPPIFFHSRELPGADTADNSTFGLRLDVPPCDGTNLCLWQPCCEDKYRLWSTPSYQWISLATTQFQGATSRWLESAQRCLS